MIDECGIDDIRPVVTNQDTENSPYGTPVGAADIADRLEDNLYDQLSDGDDVTVSQRITSAQVYVGSILRNFGVTFDLDNRVIRELVILNTIYEMHMAHGHEEAGREYRTRAKDIILVTWGNYKDTDASGEVPVQTAAVARPRKRRDYTNALDVDAGRPWGRRIP
jgi:hypothetical protein